MEEMKRRCQKSIPILSNPIDNLEFTQKDKKIKQNLTLNLFEIQNKSDNLKVLRKILNENEDLRKDFEYSRYSSRCGINPEAYLNESAALLNSITTTSGISTTMNSSVLEEFQEEFMNIDYRNLTPKIDKKNNEIDNLAIRVLSENSISDSQMDDQNR